jgi:hypothetical protein
LAERLSPLNSSSEPCGPTALGQSTQSRSSLLLLDESLRAVTRIASRKPAGHHRPAFHSIYFFDPNGHRVELACPDPDEAEMHRRLDAVTWAVLEEWSQTKRAPKHAAFLHEREFKH